MQEVKVDQVWKYKDKDCEYYVKIIDTTAEIVGFIVNVIFDCSLYPVLVGDVERGLSINDKNNETSKNWSLIKENDRPEPLPNQIWIRFSNDNNYSMLHSVLTISKNEVVIFKNNSLSQKIGDIISPIFDYWFYVKDKFKCDKCKVK